MRGLLLCSVALGATISGTDLLAQGSDSPRPITLPFARCHGGRSTPELTDTIIPNDQADKHADLVKPRTPVVSPSLPDSAFTGLRLVVDTMGRVDPCRAWVIQETSESWTRAVLKVVGQYQFAPAERLGKKVRVWLDMPFTFRRAPR